MIRATRSRRTHIPGHSELSKVLGPTTVAKCYRLTRTILGTAVTDELISRNPCRIEHAGVERAAERPVATVAQVYAAELEQHLGAWAAPTPPSIAWK